MQVTVVDFAKDRIVYNMTGCTKEELDNKLNLFFTSQGYREKKQRVNLLPLKKATEYYVYFLVPL